jgi:hypothetical protein
MYSVSYNVFDGYGNIVFSFFTYLGKGNTSDF